MVRWTHLIDKNRTTKQQTLIVVPNNNGGLAGLSDGLVEEMWRAENDQRGDEEKRKIHKYLFTCAFDWMVRRRMGSNAQMEMWMDWELSAEIEHFFPAGTPPTDRKTNKKQSHGSFRIFYANAQFGRFEEVKTQVVVREMWKSGEENGSFKMDFYTLSYGNWKASSRLMFLFFMIMENLVKNASTRKSPWPKSQLRVVSSWISISYQKIPSNRNRNL